MRKTLLVIAVIVCVVAAGVSYVVYNQMQVADYFAPYAKNPVISTGPSGSWDSAFAFWSSIILKDGVYYLFYCGSSSNILGLTVPYNLSIGYATSTDGYTFTKSSSNPILTGAAGSAVLWDGKNWVFYYEKPVEGAVGNVIWRATAPDPSGPWIRDEKPVLEIGSSGEWDSVAISPDCVIRTDSTYIMYYSVVNVVGDSVGIGLATSTDGITWTKYNNASTGSPYAESDPVLLPGPATYDAYHIWKSSVRKTATGFEMFYTGEPGSGLGGIDYATSPDGIHWTKFAGNPIMSSRWHYWDTTFFVKDSTYFLYYETTFWKNSGGGNSISVATGSKPPFTS